jgi:hypothetical protein
MPFSSLERRDGGRTSFAAGRTYPMAKKWYVIQAYSGYEGKVKL